MRRADRLFQIIQILRRGRGPITAQAIATELETSKRTIYRDMATLISQRVPIRGEASLGYVLEGGFDLPPLMLTTEEIEAAVLGAQWVTAFGDPSLARAARDFTAKIAAILPERLRPRLETPAAETGNSEPPFPDSLDIARVREAIHAGKKIAITYRDAQGCESERVIWPIRIGYWESVRLLIAWCELRGDFRHFRTDRVVSAEFLDIRIPESINVLRKKWLKTLS